MESDGRVILLYREMCQRNLTILGHVQSKLFAAGVDVISYSEARSDVQGLLNGATTDFPILRHLCPWENQPHRKIDVFQR